MRGPGGDLESPSCPSPQPSLPGEGAGSPSELAGVLLIRRGRGGGAPTERKSEGGWVGRSGAQRTLVRDGGVGGGAPYEGRAPVLEAWTVAPAPRGSGCPSAFAAAGRAIRAGAWGRSPHGKKIRGRVGGPERRAAPAPPGWGVGAGFTGRGDTPQGPPRETRACSRCSQSGYVLAAACSARRAIARGRPSKMRRCTGQSAYQ